MGGKQGGRRGGGGGRERERDVSQAPTTWLQSGYETRPPPPAEHTLAITANVRRLPVAPRGFIPSLTLFSLLGRSRSTLALDLPSDALVGQGYNGYFLRALRSAPRSPAISNKNLAQHK